MLSLKSNQVTKIYDDKSEQFSKQGYPNNIESSQLGL